MDNRNWIIGNWKKSRVTLDRWIINVSEFFSFFLSSLEELSGELFAKNFCKSMPFSWIFVKNLMLYDVILNIYIETIWRVLIEKHLNCEES